MLRKYPVMLIIISLIICSLYSIHFFSSRYRRSFSTCRGNLFITSHNKRFQGRVSFIVTDDRGLGSLSGTVQDGDAKNTVVHREISFSIVSHDGFQMWGNDENHKLSYDNTPDDELALLLQDFYVHQHARLAVFPVRTPVGRMLLVKSTMSAFLCTS